MQTGIDRRALIADITNAIIAGYSPERIILFGSLAQERGTDGSDIDLLIIKETEESFLERMVTVLRTVSGLRLRVGLDALVLTPDELAERLRIGDQFIGDIWEHGETLYVAA